MPPGGLGAATAHRCACAVLSLSGAARYAARVQTFAFSPCIIGFAPYIVLMRRRLLVLVVTIASSLGCPMPPPEVPRGPANIAGRVTALDRAGERIGSARIEAQPAVFSGPKAIVRVGHDSEILLAGPARTDFNALRVGQWVRVWYDGHVLESYPEQAVAGTIVIDSAAAMR